MKKTFKGFTLVECLVALAILAIACQILGGIAVHVGRTNTYNHFMNSSLSNQMAFIENYEKTDTVKITSTHSGTTPPSGTNSGTSAYVKITKFKSNGTDLDTSSSYSYPVDIYIMYSRDTKNVSSAGKKDDGTAGTYGDMAAAYSKESGNEKEGNLRYKYILGH